VKLLEGEQPDEVVWTADITYWISGQRASGTVKPEWESEEGYLQLHRELGILPKLIESGFDAIEALTPKPAGDLQVTEIRELAGSRKAILWGGVPGVMFAPPFTWEQMEEHIKNLLDGWRTAPFIMGVADQVPPDGNIEYCKRISELIRR
jgi:hypothetical protein